MKVREGLARGVVPGEDRGEDVPLPFAAGVVGVLLLVGCDEGVLVASPRALGSPPPHEATVTVSNMTARRRILVFLDSSGTTNGSWPARDRP